MLFLADHFGWSSLENPSLIVPLRVFSRRKIFFIQRFDYSALFESEHRFAPLLAYNLPQLQVFLLGNLTRLPLGFIPFDHCLLSQVLVSSDACPAKVDLPEYKIRHGPNFHTDKGKVYP